MKDHEIVLKREEKLAKMERDVNGSKFVETDASSVDDRNFGLIHELSHYVRDKRR